MAKGACARFQDRPLAPQPLDFTVGYLVHPVYDPKKHGKNAVRMKGGFEDDKHTQYAVKRWMNIIKKVYLEHFHPRLLTLAKGAHPGSATPVHEEFRISRQESYVSRQLYWTYKDIKDHARAYEPPPDRKSFTSYDQLDQLKVREDIHEWGVCEDIPIDFDDLSRYEVIKETVNPGEVASEDEFRKAWVTLEVKVTGVDQSVTYKLQPPNFNPGE